MRFRVFFAHNYAEQHGSDRCLTVTALLDNQPTFTTLCSLQKDIIENKELFIHV